MATITVKQDGTGNYKTIKDAIANASNGDTVVVYGSVDYHENVVTVNVANLTIEANSGDSPVLTGKVDTGGAYSTVKPTTAYPTSGAWAWTSLIGQTEYRSFKFTGLVSITANGVTWDGIDVIRSSGRGFTVLGDDVTIQNCTISNNRGSAVYTESTDNLDIYNCVVHDNVSFYLGNTVTSNGGNHPGCLAFKGTGGTSTIRTCNIYQNAGETILFDVKRFGATGLTVTDSTIGDGRRALSYLHASKDIEFNRCIFYTSSDQNVAPDNQLISFPYMKNLETASNDPNNHPVYCSIQNAYYYNCLFVNTMLVFGGQKDVYCVKTKTLVPGDTIHVKGCTFVNVDGSLPIKAEDWGYYNNVTIEGNIFYTTRNMTSGQDYILGNPARAAGWTIQNNLFNKQPIGADIVLVGDDDVVADPDMVNPTAIILAGASAVNEDNYKLNSGSSAIAEYDSPITVDFYNNTRTTPASSLGFHDFTATGTTPPTDEAPVADFDMKVSGVDVTQIATGTTIDLTDESVAGSGFNIDSWAWVVQIKGSTTYSYTAATQDYSVALTQEGLYTIKLTVTQDSDPAQSAFATKQLNVVTPTDDPEDPEDPVNPPVDERFSDWVIYTKAGTPDYTYRTRDTLVGDPVPVRKITCETGDQGGWHADYTGVVTASTAIEVKVDAEGDFTSGNGTLLVLYYTAAGALLGSDVATTNITDTLDDEHYLTFNGTTGNIACGSDAALDDLHDDAMTVEAWVKADTLGENNAGVIVSKTNDGTDGWSLKITSSGLVAYINCATTDGTATASSFTADGLWHHIAFTWDDAADDYPTIYIDGVDLGDSSQTRSGAIVTDASRNLVIGNRVDGARAWEGDIAWVRISDSVRYTDTFKPPSRVDPPASDANTVEQWNLNDGTGTTAAAEEDTPTNDGTITGATWTAITSNVFKTFTVSDTTPATAAKIRVDVRLWNGVGSLSWKYPRIVHGSALDTPEAIISAQDASGNVLSTGDNIQVGTVVTFDATASTGDSLSYLWTMYKFDPDNGVVSQWGDTDATIDVDITFSEEGVFDAKLDVTQSDGQINSQYFRITVGSDPTTNFDKFLEGSEGAQDIIEAKGPFTVILSPGYSPETLLPSEYKWEIYDDDITLLQTSYTSGNLKLVFPLPGYEDTTTYGVKLTTTFVSGATAEYVEYSSIVVTGSFVPVIGPVIPETISPQTKNTVTKDGEHTHAAETTQSGEPGAFLVSDHEGQVIMQYVRLEGGTSAALGYVTSSYVNAVRRMIVMGAIQFVGAGVLEAVNLYLDAPNVYARRLPTNNPNVEGMLWNDSGTVKVSTGIDTGENESGNTVVEEYITTGNDDGHETSGGVVTLDTNLLKLNSTYTTAAFRFQGLAIAGTDTIESCTLKIYVHGNGLTINADIGFDDADDSAALTTGASDLSGRSMTTATVTKVETYASAGWKTIDLGTASLQEVIDRGSWASGNDVTVLLSQNSGSDLAVQTYDYYGTAALLRVEYSS